MLISSLSIILIISTFKFISSSPAIKDRDRYMPNGFIPYTIDSSVTGDNLNHIKEAIKQINDETAVVLFERTDESPYLEIVNKYVGCFTPEVGAASSQANMVQINVELCVVQPELKTKSALHELLHALGLGHTQTREDRDKHVTIHFDKMDQEGKEQSKLADVNVYDDCLKYDYLSVMHYDRFTNYDPKQADQGCNPTTNPDLCPITITTKDPTYQNKIGYATKLSKNDIECINGLYSTCRVAFYSEDNFKGTKYYPFGNKDNSTRANVWGLPYYDESDLEALGLYGKEINSMEIEVEPYTNCSVAFGMDFNSIATIGDNSKNSQSKSFRFTRSELTNLGFTDDKINLLQVNEISPCEYNLNGRIKLRGNGNYKTNSFKTIGDGTTFEKIDWIEIRLMNKAECSIYMDGCAIHESSESVELNANHHVETWKYYYKQELIDRGCKVDESPYIQFGSRAL